MTPYTPLQNTNTVFSLTESTDALGEAAVAFLRIGPRTQALPQKTRAVAAAASTPPRPLYWCSTWQFCFLVCGVKVADEAVDVAVSWDVFALVSALARGMVCLPLLSCLTENQNSSIVPDPVFPAVVSWVCLGHTGGRGQADSEKPPCYPVPVLHSQRCSRFTHHC